MTPEEIKSKMIMLKKKQIEIAKMANVSPAAVCMIIHRRGKSKKIQVLIARELGLTFERVWGKAA